MAFSLPKTLVAGLALGLPWPAGAQAPAPAPDALDMTLSAECRVPGPELALHGPLHAVKAGLQDGRPVKVLVLGSPGAGRLGLGAASSQFAAQLGSELERRLPGLTAVMEQRVLPGETTAEAVERITGMVAEVSPDLVVWQVGTNDALAKADLQDFSRALREVLDWLSGHEIDAVVIEPPYVATVASDEYFTALIAAVEAEARQAEVPLVRRFHAMRYLSRQKTDAARSQFGLSDLGQRCKAEFAARTIALSVEATPAADPPAPGAGPAQPAPAAAQP